ncbi:MAG: NINE protein [Microcystaceae cyanobacterium]
MRKLLSQPKSRKVAIILALLATISPIPIAGIHKFYLGQPLWGIIYLLLWNTPMPRIACAIDAVWYFIQEQEQFAQRFKTHLGSPSSPSLLNLGGINPHQVGAIAEALRELDRLRADGLMSEYEFEQKRRQLLDRIA